ncbi:iron-siderophore ABC transporter substrate-binding protein [Crossiella sp. CA-258035]|uniref:iron-siderophore ABC transporter substrate-binding protein n=1 Tax=Crossiella sp. CA-258035 TaxID=2981138 RepID=UPI0024BD1AE6|nr:iron-siderophore ABC transporter substrate-binding protein [Crossiella sp. CA-258035]WHT21772.1 iron-siderophore ABC transporter substrate-binding protein [Crossiella sp. CA-258035]
MSLSSTAIRNGAALLVSAALVVAAGCGSAPEAPPPAAAAGYPVTLTHKLGTTTIPATPKRIVVLGEVDQDALLALGITPVGMPRSREHPSGITPWAKAKLNGVTPELLTAGDSGFDPEQVLKLQPDLILANTDYYLEKYYSRLSAFVPTTAFELGAYQDGWQAVTRQVGKAVGKAAEADKLVADTESALARTRADNPALQGKRATMAQAAGAGKLYALREPKDPAGVQLGAFGLRIPESLQALPGNFAAELSAEQYDKLDVDLLLINYDGSADNEREVESNPLFRNLRVVKAGGRIIMTGLEFHALRTPTPGNIPWLITEVLPKLRKAVSG